MTRTLLSLPVFTLLLATACAPEPDIEPWTYGIGEWTGTCELEEGVIDVHAWVDTQWTNTSGGVPATSSHSILGGATLRLGDFVLPLDATGSTRMLEPEPGADPELVTWYLFLNPVDEDIAQLVDFEISFAEVTPGGPLEGTCKRFDIHQGSGLGFDWSCLDPFSNGGCTTSSEPSGNYKTLASSGPASLSPI